VSAHLFVISAGREKMAHDVFISYSTKNKIIADAVCAKLEENKIRVWIAPRDVPAGANFANSIIAAIDSCKVFVLIWSEHTSEHILTEINHAFDQDIVIIPFRIQNIQPTNELLYYLGRTHWLDAIDPPLENHIMTLVNTVRTHINSKGQQDNNILKDENSPETPKTERHIYKEKQIYGKNPREFVKYLIIGSTLLIILLALLFLLKSFNSSIPANKTDPTMVPTTQLFTSTQTMKSEPIPLDLIGVWKSDNLHAPDNSWNIPNSLYFRFTNTQQYTYYDENTFNGNQPSDVSDIVYVNINDSTFIKKLVIIPDHPEDLGKFQKWTWRFDNGNILFTIYDLMDSQDLALNDNTINGLATGVNVK